VQLLKLQDSDAGSIYTSYKIGVVPDLTISNLIIIIIIIIISDGTDIQQS